MSRRERIKAILAEIDKADNPAVEFGLSTRLVRKYLRPELRLLWAKDDADARLERLLARDTCQTSDIRRAKEAKREAQEAYEADND